MFNLATFLLKVSTPTSRERLNGCSCVCEVDHHHHHHAYFSIVRVGRHRTTTRGVLVPTGECGVGIPRRGVDILRRGVDILIRGSRNEVYYPPIKESITPSHLYK
jgi:hypothetical protein